MEIEIKGKVYNVIINKKFNTKNTYIRVDNDLNILVNTNYLSSNRYLKKVLKEKEKSIYKMIKIKEKENDNENYFFYLGKKYFIKEGKLKFDLDSIYLPKNFNKDKWQKEKIKEIAPYYINEIKNNFSRKLPDFDVKYRKMKSRWGVCNLDKLYITLNTLLIEKDIEYLKYVIVHELAHFIEGNHSKAFWKIVEENYPNYKKIRKGLKSGSY